MFQIHISNPELHPNSKEAEFWMSSIAALLLVTWSPWVNGFTLSFFGALFFLPFISFPCVHINFYLIFFHILHRITLEIMTLQPKCEDVETAEGVAITVTGVAQVNHHTFLGMPDQIPLTPYPYLPFSGRKAHNQSRGGVYTQSSRCTLRL